MFKNSLLLFALMLSFSVISGCAPAEDDDTQDDEIVADSPQEGDETGNDDDENNGDDNGTGDDSSPGTGDDGTPDDGGNETPDDNGDDNGTPDDNGGGDDTPDDNGGNDDPDGDTPPNPEDEDAGKSSRQVWREQVYNYTLRCIGCHGISSGSQYLIASVTLEAGFPEQALAAVERATNLSDVSQSLLITTFQVANGHNGFCNSPEDCQVHVDELTTRLTRWKAAIDREIAAQPNYPDVTIANIDNGRTQYQSLCLGSGCHNADGTGSFLGEPGDTFAGTYGPTYATMPVGNVTACDEACANDVTAYLCLEVYAGRNDICLDLNQEAKLNLLSYTDLDITATLSAIYDLNLPANLGPTNSQTPALVEDTQAIAKAIIEQNDLTACDSDNALKCAKQFIAINGHKLYGRALTQDEIQTHLADFAALMAASNQQYALEQTLSAMILSSPFMHRVQ